MYRAIESRSFQSIKTERARGRLRFFDLALTRTLNEEEILAKHHRKRCAHTIKIIYQIYILIQRCVFFHRFRLLFFLKRNFTKKSLHDGTERESPPSLE